MPWFWLGIMSLMSVFSKALERLKLSRSSPVAVAVSGGSDSLALTYLATKTFDRVVGITVDNRVKEGSYEASLKAGEEVVKLGAEHRIISLEWDVIPPPGKIHMLTRARRTTELLKVCTELDIKVLMFGHHQNDQTETFLLRMAKGSGIYGLACMSPVVTWPAYPSIKVVRPLLQCSKDSLVQLCQENNLKWVEDPDNESPVFQRVVIRRMLEAHPNLHLGLLDIVKMCSEAKKVVHPKVMNILSSLPKINSTYGYVTIDMDRLRHLSLPVAMRTLPAILMYTGGRPKYTGTKIKVIHYKRLLRLVTFCKQPSQRKAITFDKCVIFPLPEKHVFAFARTLSQDDDQRFTPIRVGETTCWDGRFVISLQPLDPAGLKNETKGTVRWDQRRQIDRDRQVGSEEDVKYPLPIDGKPIAEVGQFFVRHMQKHEWAMARKGVRKVRRFLLPPVHTRGGLPVIVDWTGKVVLIPHFKMIDRSAGVTCRVQFKPQRRIEDLAEGMEPS